MVRPPKELIGKTAWIPAIGRGRINLYKQLRRRETSLLRGFAGIAIQPQVPLREALIKGFYEENPSLMGFTGCGKTHILGEGCERRPAGAEARVDSAVLMARLKPCHDASYVPQ